MPQNSANPSIIFCITELDVGGAEKAMVRIAAGLKGIGWQVRVISLRDDGPLAEELRDEGIDVVALNCGGFADIRCFWKLKSNLQNNPADVLMCFLHQANIYGRLAGKAAGIGCVVSGIRVADRRRWIAVTERMTGCCTDHYIAVSRHVAETHASLCHIDADKISHIPNGVDLADNVDREAVSEVGGAWLADSKHRLLFVGRLCDQKDPLTLVQAFLHLPDKLKRESSLAIVGDGPLRSEVQQSIERLQLTNRIRLLGRRDDVDDLMKMATVLILPSRWEGMPNVVLESMAIGLPVIATNVDGTKELITDGQTGWLVQPGCAESLAEAGAGSLVDENERAERSKRAQILAATRFSWENAIKQYDQNLRSLLDNNTRAHD